MGTWVMALLYFFLFIGRIITHSMPGPSAYSFVLRPVTLPQPDLGRIAEQVQVLVA